MVAGAANSVEIDLLLTERAPLRYTPAGLPCQEAIGVVEAGSARAFAVRLIAFDTAAMQLSGVPLGVACRVRGRLGAASAKRRQSRHRLAPAAADDAEQHAALPTQPDPLRITVDFVAAMTS
jgi:hypothetical protein